MFLVTTQKDHAEKSAKSAREAAARSFLTTRQHAQRHARDGRLYATAAIQTIDQPKQRPGKRLIFDQQASMPHHSRGRTDLLGEKKIQRKNESAEHETKEDLSINDVFDIFGYETIQDRDQLPFETSPLEHKLKEKRCETDTTELSHKGAVIGNACQQALQDDGKSLFGDFVEPVPQIADSDLSSNRFGRLALNITKEEESLLHFYLSRGRCWLLGTSLKPQRCVALDVAQTFLECDPIYILAHVIIGELFYSKMTQRPLRPHYYSRSAQMYKSVRELLANEQISFHRKLWALIQISMLEHTAQRPELQAIHAQAIDEFVQANGGISALLSQSAKDDPVQLNCRLFAVQFVRSGTFNLTSAQIFTASSSFLHLLLRMRTCASRCASHRPFSNHHHDNSDGHELTNPLSPLVDYLYHLLRKWSAASDIPTAFQANMGALVCIFSLAITIVEHDLSTASTLLYLKRTQTSMQRSTTLMRLPGRELENLHPVAAAYIFGQVRSEMFPQRADEREVRISQLLVDVQRTCALLGPERRRIEVMGQVLRFVMYMTGLAAYRLGEEGEEKMIGVLDRDWLAGLQREVDTECVRVRDKETTC